MEGREELEEIEEIERFGEAEDPYLEEILPADSRLFQERSKDGALVLEMIQAKVVTLTKAPPIDLRVDGKAPTMDLLVEKLEQQFTHQHRVNQANLQLNYLNYVVGLANYVKNKKLENALEEGHKRIRDLVKQINRDERDIKDLKASMECLNLEVEENRQKAQEIEIKLMETESKLGASIESYHEEVVRQRKTVEEWNKTKFRHDLLFDAFTGIVGGILVNQFIIHYPIQILSSILFSKKQPRAFATSLTKLALWLWFMHYSKQQAKQFGLHNNVGSWVDYLSKFSSGFMGGGGSTFLS